MKKLSIKLAGALFLMVQMTAVAQAQNLYQQLLEASGLKTQVEMMPQQVLAGLAQAPQQDPSMSKDVADLLNTTAKEAFTGNDIIEAVTASLKQNLKPEQVKALLKWYSSDAGKAIVAAETAVAEPQAISAMQQQAQQLMSNQKMIALAQRLNAKINATDFAMQLQVNTMASMYTGIMSVAQPQQKMDIATMRQQMAAQMAPMKQNLDTMVLLSMVYAYKDVAEDKLAKYEAFLDKGHTKQFMDATISGVTSGFEKVTNRWGKTLAEKLEASKAVK